MNMKATHNFTILLFFYTSYLNKYSKRLKLDRDSKDCMALVDYLRVSCRHVIYRRLKFYYCFILFMFMFPSFFLDYTVYCISKSLSLYILIFMDRYQLLKRHFVRTWVLLWIISFSCGYSQLQNKINSRMIYFFQIEEILWKEIYTM
jgi:hypothetical protein